MSTEEFSMPPWQATAGAVDNPRLIVADVDGLPVCAMSLRGVFGNTKKMEANAHLIAAAPDMYEALKSLTRDCEIANMRWVDQVGIGAIDINALSHARAAIAKAEEES